MATICCSPPDNAGFGVQQLAELGEGFENAGLAPVRAAAAGALQAAEKQVLRDGQVGEEAPGPWHESDPEPDRRIPTRRAPSENAARCTERALTGAMRVCELVLTS